jgi:hypothetical protein
VIPLVRLEVLKLRGPGLTVIVALALVVLLAFATVNGARGIDAHPSRQSEIARTDGDPVRAVGRTIPPDVTAVRDTREALGAWAVVALVALGLGVLVSAREAATGTLARSLLACPDRRRLAGAKALLLLASSVVAAPLAFLLSAPAAWAWAAHIGTSPRWGIDDYVLLVAGGTWATVCLGIAGVGIGLLVPGVALSMVAAFGALFLVEPVIGARAPEVASWLPAHLVEAAFRGTAHVADAPLHGQAAALLLLFAWSAVLFALGASRLVRTDVR